MKKRIKLIFPVPMNEHTKDMVESQTPAALIGDNVDVEFAGSKELMTLTDSYYDLFIMESIVLEAGMKAEEEVVFGKLE